MLGLGAAWVMRVLGALLFGVQATDPLVLAGVPGVLIVASLFAIYIPARRAAGVDPMAALRCE